MPNPNSNIAARRFKCRHIFTEGRRCGSPTLRNEDFCYYHHTTRRSRPNQGQARPHDAYNEPPNQTTLLLPHPEDPGAIQHSIGEIMNSLATNALDPRRAGLLLYALQIASQNLKKNPRQEDKRLLPPEKLVEEITVDPELGPVAPAAEYTEEDEPDEYLGQSTLKRLIRRMELIEEDSPAPSVALQATAEQPSPLPRPCRLGFKSGPKSNIERTLQKKYTGEGAHRTPHGQNRYSKERTPLERPHPWTSPTSLPSRTSPSPTSPRRKTSEPCKPPSSASAPSSTRAMTW